MLDELRSAFSAEMTTTCNPRRKHASTLPSTPIASSLRTIPSHHTSALSTYFFGLWHSDETNLELAHSCKLLRDIMRIVRLPIFVRNVLAVWRYFEANRLAQKRRSL